MEILAIIPARYSSSRFPGKPLALVDGVPMIVRVLNRVKDIFEHVCVATDNEQIFMTVEENGGVAIMTKEDHKSGTDRCLEALEKYEKKVGKSFDVVVNVQGDEPYISHGQLKTLAQCFENKDVEIATLVKPTKNLSDIKDPNRPKVVVSKDNFAIYFSRSVIPFYRGGELTQDVAESANYFTHIGLYGYRTETLRKICSMEESYLEKTEKLEQLRWLENGIKIKVGYSSEESYSVDTVEDLERINNLHLK